MLPTLAGIATLHEQAPVATTEPEGLFTDGWCGRRERPHDRVAEWSARFSPGWVNPVGAG